MRKPMVTRTVKLTEAVVLCVNLDTNEVADEKVSVARECKNETALMKKVKEVIPANLMPIKIKESSVKTVRMGMTEEEFMAVAKVLDDEPKA